jgi:hypothetical protein
MAARPHQGKPLHHDETRTARLAFHPLHNPVKRGTLGRLIRDAGLTVDEFVALL